TLGRMMVYYDYLSRARSERIGRGGAELERLSGLRAESEATQRRLAALEPEQAAGLEAEQRARAERAALLAAAAPDIARAGGELERLRAEERRLAELVTSLTEALAAFPVGVDEPFPRMRGKLPWPVRGRIVG